MPGKMKGPSSWTCILNLRPSSFKTPFFLSSTVTRSCEAESSLCLLCPATIFKPRLPWSQRPRYTWARLTFVLHVPLSICWHIPKRGNCVQASSFALWVLSSQASPLHTWSNRPIYTRLMIFVHCYLFESCRAWSVSGKETSPPFVTIPATLFFLNLAPTCSKRPM